jgi:DNA polymerase elongation subunit (family B)
MLAYIWQARVEYVGQEMMNTDTTLLSWAAKWRGDKKTHSMRLTSKQAIEQDDRELVEGLAEMVRAAGLVVAHNGDKFDIPVLRTRAVMLGLEPLGPVQSIDTLKLARSSFRFSHNRLDYLAKQLLGTGKMPTGGFDLWRRCIHGDEAALKRMERYNRRDVVLLEQVFDAMLPHLKGVPRLWFAQGMECTFCGSEYLTRRGFQHTAVHTYVRYQCQNCLRYSRSRTSATDGGRRPDLAPVG